MPINSIEEFEKALRSAVANVKDQASYSAARRMIFEASLDSLNAVGPKSNKSALNFGLDGLIKYVLESQTINMLFVRYRLSIVDVLLSKGASLAALEHPETKELLLKIRKKCEITLGVLKLNGYKISEEHKKLLAISYCITEQQEIAQKIDGLKNELRGRTPPHGVKALFLCEAHDDLGSSKFLNYLKQDLIRADYNNLCLEYCDDLNKPMYNGNPAQATSAKIDQNYIPLSKFAAQPEFRSNITVIDLIRVFSNDRLLDEMQKELCIEIVYPSCFNHLRELGMIYKALAAILQQQGNFIFVIGAMHAAKIINSIERIGVETIVIAPFEDHRKLQLKQVNIQTYVPADDHGYSELYSVHGCQPINMSNILTDKLLRDFAARHLSPVDRNSVGLDVADKQAKHKMLT